MLADIIGNEPIARPQVTQKLWVYIKENALQDSADKRYILCDAKLKKIFDIDRLHITQMPGKLSDHLIKP